MGVLKEVLKSNATTLGGAAAGGIAGGLHGFHKGKGKHKGDKAFEGALGGMFAGGMLGHGVDRVRFAKRMASGGYGHSWGGGFSRPASSHSKPFDKAHPWAKGAKTQREIKKRYHKQTRELHPDLAPAHEKAKKTRDFQSFQEEHGGYEKHPGFSSMPKEAAVRFLAFGDELRGIFGL